MELQINLKRLVAIGDSELVALRPVKSFVFCENDLGSADQLCRRAPAGKVLVIPRGWGDPQGGAVSGSVPAGHRPRDFTTPHQS